MYYRKSFATLMLASTLILTITSCNKDDNPTPPATEIKDGSQWVFKVSQYNEAGTVTSSSNITLKATAQTLSGSSWYVLTETTSSAQVIAIQKRSDGWWQIPLPATAPSLWYKNPAAVNDTYSLTINNGTTDNAKVTSTTATVTVPAGTYTNCTEVEGNDTNSLEEKYSFSSTGPILIKLALYDEKVAGPASNVYMSRSWELVSFTP